MFKAINISPHSAPHRHLRAQEASTVLKRPLLRAPLRCSAQSPPCSLDHTLGHVAHCSAAASLLGPHAVAICPPAQQQHLAPGLLGPAWARRPLWWQVPLQRALQGMGVSRFSQSSQVPTQPFLGGSSYLREAALAQTQAEVPVDLPLVSLFWEPRGLPQHPTVPFPDTDTNMF